MSDNVSGKLFEPPNSNLCVVVSGVPLGSAFGPVV